MSADPAARGAREQLTHLARNGAHVLDHFAELPPVVAPRQAAVLVLFGVLDAILSDSAARANAVSRDLDVLLLARASTLRAHPGQIAFPGGRIDAGDAGAESAALREAVEETGLDPDGIDVLGTLESIPLAYSRYQVTPVVAWWRHPSPVRPVDVAESSHVFRAPVADLLDPAHRGSTVIHRDGREWRGPAFELTHATGRHLVWGFTAMVLDGLFERLGWTEPWDAARELPIDFAPQATRRWD